MKSVINTDLNLNLMKGIDFYALSSSGDYAEIQIECLARNPEIDRSRNIGDLLTVEETHLIENHWQERAKLGHFDSELGTLWDSRGPLIYGTMQFKQYDFFANQNEKGNHPRTELSEQLRPSAVSSVVETADGYIAVQKRADGILAAGKIDASAAGICQIINNRLDLKRKMLEKLTRELSLETRELENLTPVGICRVSDYFASLILYKVVIEKTFEELKEGINKELVAGLSKVSRENLPEFIIDHYAINNDLIGPGCSNFLACLDKDEFDGVAHEINSREGSIRTGALVNGNFIEQGLIG